MTPNEIAIKEAFHTVPVNLQWWLTGEMMDHDERPISTLRIKHTEHKFYFDVKFSHVDEKGVWFMVRYCNPELKVVTRYEPHTLLALISLLRHSDRGSAFHDMEYQYSTENLHNTPSFVRDIMAKHSSLKRLNAYTCDNLDDLEDVLNFLADKGHNTAEFVYVYAAVKARDPEFVALLRKKNEEDMATCEIATMQLVDGKLKSETIAMAAAAAINMYNSGFTYEQIFSYTPKVQHAH